jgi:YD repeat-containing protein
MITIALLTTLATLAPAQAQDVRFHDAQGRVTGTARTDRNGVTTFRDAAGRITGSIRR